jgi:hypothetical protein
MDERETSGVLVAVFPDEATAERAAQAARQAGAQSLEVGGQLGEQASLRSEMREELSNSAAGTGGMGMVTKEMGKGLSLFVPVGAVIGAILFLPLALISMGDLSAGARVLIVMACGAFAGAVVGLVLGGAFGARRPGEAMAAQRGVTVTVAPATPAVERAVADLHPVRIDVVNRGGTPLDIYVDERRDDVSTPRRVGRNAAADDYQVPPEAE